MSDSMTSFISPTLPRVARTHRAARVFCGRKPRRRVKNPVPAQTRVLPELPALPTPPPPPQLVPLPPPPPSAKLLTGTLQSRQDAIVVTHSALSPLVTALFCRENSEHALVLLPTRTQVLRLAALLQHPDNIPKQSRKTRVIVAAGKGEGVWKYPAMNANSSTHSVIVLATPRSIFNQFFNSHGLPWLGKVRFLLLAGVSEILGNGAGRDLYKVVQRIRGSRKTVIVEGDYEGETKGVMDGMVREKHKVIEWQEQVCKDDVVVEKVEKVKKVKKEECLISASPKRGLEYLIKLVDEHENDRVVIFFPATRVLEVYANILRSLGRSIIDIHSKTSIGNRARGFEMFKSCGILFATDTVLDEIEDVDLVVSFGIVEEETYRRRLGVGKRGLVIVRPEISEKMKFVGEGQVVECEEGVYVSDEEIRGGVGEKARRTAYQALVTLYIVWRRRIGWTRPEMVEFVNVWARELFGEVPEIEKKFAGRRRLMRYPDTRIRKGVCESVARPRKKK